MVLTRACIRPPMASCCTSAAPPPRGSACGAAVADLVPLVGDLTTRLYPDAPFVALVLGGLLANTREGAAIAREGARLLAHGVPQVCVRALLYGACWQVRALEHVAREVEATLRAMDAPPDVAGMVRLALANMLLMEPGGRRRIASAFYARSPSPAITYLCRLVEAAAATRRRRRRGATRAHKGRA